MKTIRIFLTLCLLVSLALAVIPVQAATEHCPSGGDKYDSGSGSVTIDGVTVSWGGHTVSVSGGTATFCAKAGTQASGKVTITNDSWYVDWQNGGGQTPNISYLTIYPPEENPTQTPKLTETPTNTSVPTDTPEVTETSTPEVLTETPGPTTPPGTTSTVTVTPPGQTPTTPPGTTSTVTVTPPGQTPTTTNTPEKVTGGPHPTAGADGSMMVASTTPFNRQTAGWIGVGLFGLMLGLTFIGKKTF